MAQKVSVEERERIIAAFGEGLSCNEIARQFNRSTNTISRIARSVGHQFAQVNAANARAINQGYTAERRANIRLKTVESVEKLIGQMFAPATLHNFGGKDNTHNSIELDEPVFRDKQAIGQTIATLWRVVKEIDAAEETRREPSRLEVIFTQLDQIADDYERGTVEPKTGVDDQQVDGPSEPV